MTLRSLLLTMRVMAPRMSKSDDEGSFLCPYFMLRDDSVDNPSCFLKSNSFPFCLLPSLFMKYYGAEGSNFERLVNELD